METLGFDTGRNLEPCSKNEGSGKQDTTRQIAREQKPDKY